MLKRVFVYIIFFLLVSGCASMPVASIVSTSRQPASAQQYHRVAKGETLWSIARSYSVELNVLAELNHISDTTRIEVGQMLAISSKSQPSTMRYKKDNFIWPLQGKILATFGSTFNNMLNKGLNIEVSGNPDIVASRAGSVVFYHDDLLLYGKTIIIDHGDGYFTVYSGKNFLVLVKPGETVVQGGRVARLNAGQNKKNHYLHFEIRKGYVAQNPYFYLP
ncbi:MAG: peptidoglycan DD-metalloendopeptidase family protein [Candidatus Omnitrophota bacterium]